MVFLNWDCSVAWSLVLLRCSLIVKDILLALGMGGFPSSYDTVGFEFLMMDCFK